MFITYLAMIVFDSWSLRDSDSRSLLTFPAILLSVEANAS